jgi:hypothetical protein
VGVKFYTCNSSVGSFNFDRNKAVSKVVMNYIVFEFNIKTNTFGKVIKRGLTRDKAKSLVAELGVGYSYGEKNRMLADFNLK